LSFNLSIYIITIVWSSLKCLVIVPSPPPHQTRVVVYFIVLFTIFNCSGSNSLTIVVSLCLSHFWVCTSLFPSWTMIDFTLRPSGVSSSNSSLSLNAIEEFLNVEFDDSTNLPSSLLVSSTTGDTVLPNLRVIIPTPTRKNKKRTIIIKTVPKKINYYNCFSCMEKQWVIDIMFLSGNN